MRCFVALDLPRPVCNYLFGLTGQFGNRGGVKWVPADQLHLTLAFAGELPDEALPAVREAVLAVELPALSMSLLSLEHFPERGDPRVIWARLAGDVEALGRLHEDLAVRLEPLGVPRDDRPFVPHVTMGRVKSLFGALALVDQVKKVGATLRDKPFSPLALVLYQSELRRAGAIHTPLLRRPLPPLGG